MYTCSMFNDFINNDENILKILNTLKSYEAEFIDFPLHFPGNLHLKMNFMHRIKMKEAYQMIFLHYVHNLKPANILNYNALTTQKYVKLIASSDANVVTITESSLEFTNRKI